MKRRSTTLLAALAISALLLGACGSDSDSAGAAPEGEAAAEPTEPSAVETTTTEAAQDPAEVTAAVTTTIEGFFAALGEGRFDDAAKLLENGEAHASEFEGFSKLAVGVTAKTTDVEVSDPTSAIYTIDISIAGAVALPDAGGEAVLVDGEWLMSEDSWNALAALAPA